jgi:hypothetical protein
MLLSYLIIDTTETTDYLKMVTLFFVIKRKDLPYPLGFFVGSAQLVKAA